MKKQLPVEMGKLTYEKPVKLVLRMSVLVLPFAEMESLNPQKPVRIALKMFLSVKRAPAEMERSRLKLENNAIMERTMGKIENVLFLVPFSIHSNLFAEMEKLIKEKLAIPVHKTSKIFVLIHERKNVETVKLTKEKTVKAVRKM